MQKKEKKSEKPSEKPSEKNVVSHINSVKIEPSQLPKRNSKQSLNVKTFSPAASKKEMPLSVSKKLSYSTGSYKSKDISSIIIAKKPEDPRQIEINLTDDIQVENGSYIPYIAVNNEKNIMIDTNEEFQEEEIILPLMKDE
jgi:hypothetical protein